MITLSSSEVKNNFGEVLDKSQREAVRITKRGRLVAVMMSPEVLNDHIKKRIEENTEKEAIPPKKL